MTLITLLQSLQLPFAYGHFAEGQAPRPPFLIYLTPRSHHFQADNQNYFKVSVVHLEVYVDKKDIALEKRIEHMLDSHEIVYEKSEVWLANERLYEVLYTFEMEENELWEIK